MNGNSDRVHVCEPPDADTRVVFYTCPCGTTWQWRRDGDDTERWHQVSPQ